MFPMSERKKIMKIIKFFFWVLLFPFMLFVELLNCCYKGAVGRKLF